MIDFMPKKLYNLIKICNLYKFKRNKSMGIISEFESRGFYIHHSESDSKELKKARFQAHIHDKYELYYLISGNCTMRIESDAVKLMPNTVLLISPGTTHTLKLEGDTPYKRIACQLSEVQKTQISLDRNFIVTNDQNGFIYECLTSILYSKDKEEALSLYLPVIMHKLRDVSSPVITDDTETENIVYQILNFLNENLTKEINLDDIASKFYISKAHMCRKFKKYFGIGVWEFILKKRIVLAQKNIYYYKNVQKGFEKSGFNDYSTFYKQYKRQIGKSPQNDLKQYLKYSGAK